MHVQATASLVLFLPLFFFYLKNNDIMVTAFTSQSSCEKVHTKAVPACDMLVLQTHRSEGIQKGWRKIWSWWRSTHGRTEVCVCAHVHICMNMYMCRSMSMCVHVYACMYEYECVEAWVSACVFHIYVSIYACVDVWGCMHVCEFIRVWVCVCIDA